MKLLNYDHYYDNKGGNVLNSSLLSLPRIPGSLGFTQINKHTNEPMKKYIIRPNAMNYISMPYYDIDIDIYHHKTPYYIINLNQIYS